MFCAAIPMSVSIGAAVIGKEKEKRLEAQLHSETLPQHLFPIGKVTFVVIGSLIVCSAVYHLVVMPHTGAVI